MELDFSVSRHRVGDVCVVEVHGELDVVTVDTFLACGRAAAALAGTVVVDLSGTRFLDCAGVTGLLLLRRSARRRGGTVVLVGVAGPVAVVVDALGLRDAFGGGEVTIDVRRPAVPSRNRSRAARAPAGAVPAGGERGTRTGGSW